MSDRKMGLKDRLGNIETVRKENIRRIIDNLYDTKAYIVMGENHNGTNFVSELMEFANQDVDDYKNLTFREMVVVLGFYLSDISQNPHFGDSVSERIALVMDLFVMIILRETKRCHELGEFMKLKYGDLLDFLNKPCNEKYREISLEFLMSQIQKLTRDYWVSGEDIDDYAEQINTGLSIMYEVGILPFMYIADENYLPLL